AAFPAPFEIIGDRVGKGDLQFVECASPEGQDVTRVDHLAMKYPCRLIKFDGRNIAVMGHRGHRTTPGSRRNRRTDFNAPLSVSFSGRGRWNTASTSLRLTRTRDPRPSETDAPAAMNSASISAHATFARTGSAKMASRVLRCLPRTMPGTKFWYQSLARKQHLEKE